MFASVLNDFKITKGNNPSYSRGILVQKVVLLEFAAKYDCTNKYYAVDDKEHALVYKDDFLAVNDGIPDPYCTHYHKPKPRKYGYAAG